MAKKIPPAKVSGDKPFASVNNLLDKIYYLKNFRNSKGFYILIIALGILLLAIYQKSQILPAMVNGQPITGIELLGKLNEQFRTQTLNQLINEKIILEEARKNSAIPTETEITNKIQELEKNVGGAEVLNTLLTQQGQTRITLKDQIRLQLAISKLYDKEATISAEEVTKFLEQNKSSLQSTESAKQKEEAFNLLKQQKISQIFNQKFQELRQRAKIQIF